MAVTARTVPILKDNYAWLLKDTETGAMSLCTKVEAAVTCAPVIDERSSQNQIDRLLQENKELRADIKRMDEQLGLGDKPPAAGPPVASGPPVSEKPDEERPMGRSPKFNLPSERDVDQALNYVERMVKKLREKWKDIEGSGKGTPL